MYLPPVYVAIRYPGSPALYSATQGVPSAATAMPWGFALKRELSKTEVCWAKLGAGATASSGDRKATRLPSRSWPGGTWGPSPDWLNHAPPPGAAAMPAAAMYPSRTVDCTIAPL